MTIAVGTRVGLYEITQLLGAGGMGEVYRARDTKLDRPVAIKFLSSTLADAEGRRRFLREAQLASSLNHPHILTVYDAGELEDRQYLVTEYIDGCTLGEWARAGTRSYHDIADLLIGVADGLAVAHAAGILHRDIKPANILVATNGYAKLVDFGLAKLHRSNGADDEMATASVHTQVGMIVGTVRYMSPEQAAGRRLDPRSDVFSFGVVLYELVAGRRPFEGPTDLQVLQTIMHGEMPPLGLAVPESLRKLIAKALEKDPGGRYQSMSELAADLRRARQSVFDHVVARTAPAAGLRRRMVLIGIVLVVAIVAVGFGWRLWQQDYFWRNPLDGATVQKLTDFAGDEIDAAISPDGRFTSFLSDHAGPFDTWISPTGSGEFINVTKGRFPAFYPGPIRMSGFSPDSTQLWIIEQVSLRPNRLRTWLASVVTSEPHTFIESGLHPAWSPDLRRLAYHTADAGDPIFIAEANGNNARQIYVDKPGVHSHYQIWSPDGRFLYFVKGNVTSDDMDLWRLEVPSDAGSAVPEQLTHHRSRVAYPVWLDAQTLIYSATAANGAGQWLYAMDVDHRIPHRVSSGIAEQYLSVSATADARQLVVTIAQPLASLWTIPISGQTESETSALRFAAPNARALGPRFGRDSVLFLSTKGGPDGLWQMSGDVVRELWRGTDGGLVAPPALSPDGTQIAFAYRSQGRSDLHVMSANGTNVRALSDAVDVRGSFSWSPDGQWIAFAGLASGEASRIYKIPVSGGTPIPLAAAISTRPVWSPDGQFIVYSEPVQGARMQVKGITPDGKPVPLPDMWVNYQTSTPYRFIPHANALVYLKEGDVRRQNFFWIDLVSGQERQLTDLQPGSEIRDFDVSPDGRQILFDRLRDNSDVVLMDLRR